MRYQILFIDATNECIKAANNKDFPDSSWKIIQNMDLADASAEFEEAEK